MFLSTQNNLFVLVMVLYFVSSASYAQQKINDKELLIAKELAQCSAIYRVMTFVGHTSRLLKDEVITLTDDEKNYIIENKSLFPKFLNPFFNARILNRDSFYKIHEYYFLNDKEMALLKEGSPIETNAKNRWLNGLDSEDWVVRFTRCSYINVELDKIKNLLNKPNVIAAYDDAIINYELPNNKESVLNFHRILTRFAFLSWSNLGFKTQIDEMSEIEKSIQKVLPR
jgi:hypothetical protein